MPRIFLIRHAEPSLTGVILGATDAPLSARGHGQARKLAENFPATHPLAAVYASPLRRAMQSAAYLLEPWRPFALLDGLREISYGSWDGLAWDEIAARNPDLAARKAADWLGVDVPGGERWGEFEARVAGALSRILGGPLPAAIVAHQAVNAHLAHLLGGGTRTSFQQGYCEILSYELPIDSPNL
ncbi:MAG: histidine phosphatase family protein [Bryobacterales bacterium]|nr:histidine phosphatase family protein [Bryobacterales bacterium]